jgi:hypothetical protein
MKYSKKMMYIFAASLKKNSGGGGGGGGDDDEHYFDVSPLTVTHDKTSGTQIVTVSSDLEWTVTYDAELEWFMINKTSGSGDGTVVVTFKQNDDTEPRQSTLWFNAEEFRVEVSVKQSAEEHHDVDGFDDYINAFSPYVTVPIDGITYNYLKSLFDEAKSQFETDRSISGIAAVHRQSLYPVMYSFGSKIDRDAAFKTMAGWLLALQLAELKPKKRTGIFKVGYEMGGYDKYSDLYGYEFKSDPNYARIAAGAIYVAMRGKKQPSITAMRNDVGGSTFSSDLYTLGNGDRSTVGENDYFIDLREFMPTAPGPYAPGYTSRPDNTYPNEPKDSYKNLHMDRNIHEDIITKYNLNNQTYLQATVQAIADKEAEPQHLFGDNRTTTHYHFHPVFGTDTIGERISDSGHVASLVSLSITSSSSARGILQSASVSPVQYGRLRPGCSWSQEGKKNSNTDNTRNILTNFEIESGDGAPPDGWYYDQAGNLVKMSGNSMSPEEYEEAQRNALYANSYPSGHSSGIMGGAMILMELLP